MPTDSELNKMVAEIWAEKLAKKANKKGGRN